MRCFAPLVSGVLLAHGLVVTPVHADNRVVPAAQMLDAEQPDRTVGVPPATSSEDVLLGRWRWIAQCGSLGTYRGEFEIERISGGRFSGTMADSVSMTDGRIVRGERISFVRKIFSGATQHWEARLVRAGNGGPHLDGALRDSRFGRRTCPWGATKD